MVSNYRGLAEHLDDVYEELTRNETPLLEALHALEVHTVIASYFGSGDSGEVEDIEFYHEDQNVPTGDLEKAASDYQVTIEESQSEFVGGGWQTKIVAVTISLRMAIMHYCEAWLELEHPGYGIDEGGQGEMTIDVEAGQFTLNHSDRVIALETVTHARTAPPPIPHETLEI